MYEKLLICSLGPLSANSNNRGRELTKDKGLNLLIPAKLTGQSPGFNRKRQLLLSAYDDLAGANKTTHQKIQSTANTYLIPQKMVRRPSEEVENAGKKVHTSATNFNPYEGQLPLALSYLMPSPRIPNAPKTISEPVGKNESTMSFEPPIMDTRSLPAGSKTASIDVNRLTDQVCQVLERKIRLEKQRKGYR